MFDVLSIIASYCEDAKDFTNLLMTCKDFYQYRNDKRWIKQPPLIFNHKWNKYPSKKIPGYCGIQVNFCQPDIICGTKLDDRVRVVNIKQSTAFIDIENINNLETLNYENGLMTSKIQSESLQKLILTEQAGLKEIKCPKLEYLSITECGRVATVTDFEKLHTLECYGCYNLCALTSLPKLHTLILFDAHEMTKIKHMPSLKNVTVVNCSNLVSIDNEYIDVLCIWNCYSFDYKNIKHRILKIDGMIV